MALQRYPSKSSRTMWLPYAWTRRWRRESWLEWCKPMGAHSFRPATQTLEAPVRMERALREGERRRGKQGTRRVRVVRGGLVGEGPPFMNGKGHPREGGNVVWMNMVRLKEREPAVGWGCWI